MAKQKADKSPSKSDESTKPQSIMAGSHPIDMLKADPDNPREIGDDALAGLAVSLEEFGDLSGIVYNSGTGELIAGHQRVRTLREAGATEFVRLKGIGPGTDVARGYVDHPTTGERFDVRFVNWTRGKQRQANVVANSRAIAGRFTEGVDTILSQFQESDPELFGALRMDHLKAFEFNELPAMVEEDLQGGGAAPEVHEDEVPEVDETSVPDSKPGEVYGLGWCWICDCCGEVVDMTEEEVAAWEASNA